MEKYIVISHLFSFSVNHNVARDNTATFKNYLSLEDPELDATDRLDFKYELRCF